MTKKLKDLWPLAASAVFAMSCTFLAAFRHIQSYTIVR
jgi:hypothetical protein